MEDFVVSVATEAHIKYAEEISRQYEESARQRGTGIAKRSAEYIIQKIQEGKAIIAVTRDGALGGFCYIESWGNKKFAANSGLIVLEPFRKMGLAARIKQQAFELSRRMFPEAKLFGLTTSLAVMKINSDLGYRPVTFSELTDDDEFWKGCQSCVNYDILTRTNRKICLCTGMLYDPNEKSKHERKNFSEYKNKYRNWLKRKAELLFKRFRRELVLFF